MPPGGGGVGGGSLGASTEGSVRGASGDRRLQLGAQLPLLAPLRLEAVARGAEEEE